MTPVRFFFDLVSPYSWLALTRAGAFASEHGVRWELRPVVYAKVLEARGLSGPAEEPNRRRHLFADVVRCARRLGLTVTGPPAHPFRSLEALRVACVFLDEPRALELCVALAEAAWGAGRDLTDAAVLAAVVDACGLPAADLGDRCSDPAIKSRLRACTDEALASGVFGVPTFALGEELFWGHDRLEHLADRLTGRLDDASGLAARLDERPVGVVRPTARRDGNEPSS